MLKPEPLDVPSANAGMDIDSIDDEIAIAVAAAVARRRLGKPADAEMRRLHDVARRRKTLYLRQTRVFA